MLARAEPEYLEYVQPKLLPHRLSFDRASNFSTQAGQSERRSRTAMVDIQPAPTFLPTNSSQPRMNNDSDLFDTTLGDHHFSHDTASMNVDMLDWRSKDRSDALKAILPKLLSYPAHVDARPFASLTCTTPLEDLDQYQDNQSEYSHTSCDTTGADAKMLSALPTTGNLNTAMINVLDDVAETLSNSPNRTPHLGDTFRKIFNMEPKPSARQ